MIFLHNDCEYDVYNTIISLIDWQYSQFIDNTMLVKCEFFKHHLRKFSELSSTLRNKSQTGHLEGGAAMTSLIAAVFQALGMRRSNYVMNRGDRISYKPIDSYNWKRLSDVYLDMYSIYNII